MTNRTRILALSVLAGVTGVAFAGGPNEDTASPAVLGPRTVINIDPNGGSGTRSLSLQTAYDNADLDGNGAPAYAGSTNSNSPYLADWMVLKLPRTGNGPAGAFGQILEEFTFGLSAVNAGVFHDVVITFYDTPKGWGLGGVAGTGGFQAATATVIGSFMVKLAVETPQWNTFGAFTVTGLSNLDTPIRLTDNYVGVTIDTYLQDTTTRDLAVYNIFNFDENGPYIGYSEDRFARDVNADGVITELEMNRVFSGVSDPANMFFKMDVNFCDSDFDGSGFSDTDDFDAMVHAYEAGC